MKRPPLKTIRRACVYVIAPLAPLMCLVSCGGPRPAATKPQNRVPTSFRVPMTYQQACANEGPACQPRVKGRVPAALRRAPRFPRLARGQRCPTTPGVLVNTPYFGGWAFGNGPIRVLVDNAGNPRRGVIALGRNPPSWPSLKTHWFSEPSYSGPFSVRVTRLDGTTPVIQGLTPAATPLVVPPGPTVNGGDGWREAPYPTYMKQAGCYGWEVDGLTFRELIVLRTTNP